MLGIPSLLVICHRAGVDVYKKGALVLILSVLFHAMTCYRTGLYEDWQCSLLFLMKKIKSELTELLCCR